ncbi:MAG TPA: alpha-xylosidase [Treponemataceae bacterium]|nr:alpha-xylosidase [Treponemataceae bacterium]
MKQKNRFVFDMLDQDAADAHLDNIFFAGTPKSVFHKEDSVTITIPFVKQEFKNMFLYPLKKEVKVSDMRVRCYGDSVMRLTTAFGGEIPKDENNYMFFWDPSLKEKKLKIEESTDGWGLYDDNKNLRMKISTKISPVEIWSTLQPEPPESFDSIIYPDAKIDVPFNSQDNFFPSQYESCALGYVERDNNIDRCLYSLHAEKNEKFAGTGERFSGMNLAGKTFVLENTDGLGVNSRRAYKNVPFYISSRGYGILIMTSAHVRLSLADISTRATQGLVEDDVLDIFFIGGGSVEQIVLNYRKITGFPSDVPLWSYGTWMSKMTYFSAEETRLVVKKMREGKFPCDVIHIDTGWFKTDWKCEWEFDLENFPDPEKYFKEMESQGIKISLWQLPSIAKDTLHYEIAKKNRYIAPKNKQIALSSVFSAVEFDGSIDFSNPAAVVWYQGLLERLLRMGAAVIKTDFGEVIEEDAEYLTIPYKKLHNLYALLYQKAAFEITQKTKGPKDTMIWARAGWIGCQRYPVHWGGDCACSWDGMASSLCGGLHIGVSGFAFWSHDVPGFYGIPSFMNSKPPNDLYIRWTQMAVFTSHIRYHGTTAREPYEYPEIADTARKWLNLRYSLIPYFVEEGKKAIKSGYPLLRALIFHHSNDPMCWSIDDEFYCGDSFLIAPVMNSEGIRDVYLPSGRWIDFWTGKVLEGNVWLKNIYSPLELIPVFVKDGSEISVYPEIIQSTKEMDMSKIQKINFNNTYKGFSHSLLGGLIPLDTQSSYKP